MKTVYLAVSILLRISFLCANLFSLVFVFSAVVQATVASVSGMYNPYACASYTEYAVPASHTDLLNDPAVFYVSDAVQSSVAPVSGMYNPYAYIPHGDFAVPQSMVGMMPAQHVPFTAYENQQPGAMYMPVGYNEHMTAGYTLVSSYTAPIVSHEQYVIQDLPVVADPTTLEAASVPHGEPDAESTSTEATETLEAHDRVETAEASAAAAEAQVIMPALGMLKSKTGSTPLATGFLNFAVVIFAK